eukprot:CAMPEP_0194493158 /NCGR_PEP_ID=MMETSP0253-20130528/11460_1 /TAXON_ID=2966 /ORGANISM="Noctiluca scintillans" /LENGTH=1391 /DNA_ID=CAMNT_0039334111 /DNA_START=75 /DNA_END=4250 /DNA_ORIENTATION=-
MGVFTAFEDFLDMLRDRFQAELEDQISYKDEEEHCWVSSDVELFDALQAGVTTFFVSLPAEQGRLTRLMDHISKSRSRSCVSVSSVGLPELEPENEWHDVVRFWVNGKEFKVDNPSPSVTLLDWMREKQGMTVHLGCGEGGCGACTVALGLPSGKTVPINSCLRRLCAVDGCNIVTTQGLGSVQDGVHPLQDAIAQNGTQCGFCTPGWVMNMYALLENNSAPTKEEVERNFDGNLCRCTGYRPILDAFGNFAQGGKSCVNHKSIPHPVDMFSHKAQPLHFLDALTGEEYFRPLNMDQLSSARADAKSGNKEVHLVCGTTSTGVVKYLTPHPRSENTALIDLSSIPDLDAFCLDHRGLTFGATMSIGDLLCHIEKVNHPAFEVYAAHLRRVASVQVRSVGSWAGNVMLCRESFLNDAFSYFPSDIVLILATGNASMKIVVDGGAPQLVDILTLMKTKGDVLLISGRLPLPPRGALVQTYKLMRRHVFSHAIVAFGANVTFAPDQTVEHARVILAGVTSTILSSDRIRAVLVGKPLNQTTMNAAMSALMEEIDAAPANGDKFAMDSLKTAASGYLFKTFLEAAKAQGKLLPNCTSALVPFTPADSRPVSSGKESFGVDPNLSPVGTWLPKIESRIQATGEATYPSDHGVGAAFAQVVLSTSCNAKLVALDAVQALGMPGVIDFVTASDVPGTNVWTGSLPKFVHTGFGKEKIFFGVNERIPYVGAQLGVIVAETWAQAYKAARAVRQTYAQQEPPVLGFEAAVNRSAVVSKDHVQKLRAHGPVLQMVRAAGSAVQPQPQKDRQATSRSETSQSVQATLTTGEQYHMSLESHAVCAVPSDGTHMKICVSGQSPLLEQSSVATALGMPLSNVHVENTRPGGAFGAKVLWQLPTCCAAAVAAYKLRRPVRLQTERRDDMQMSGLRNSIKFDYDASFTLDGKLEACDVEISSDVGWITGIAPGLTILVDADLDCVFNFPGGLKSTHKVCLTNKAAATTMRAPGAMQAAILQGVMMDHVAKVVGKDVDEVIKMNLYKAGDKTCTQGLQLGTEIFNYTLPEMWHELEESSKYEERKVAVDEYNKSNKWTKKGISIAMSKFLIGSNFYQYSSHISAYTDGSVHVTTGGVDMGQGLNTKVAQCVAYTLGISVDSVIIGGGDRRACDSQLTGASGSSESCCNAAMVAANILKERLQPYLAKGTSWTQALLMAKVHGENLSVDGWFNGIAMQPEGPIYATYGAAVSEVMLDVLTGDTRVERVDIMMDLGTQLNAAVDIGQIQGGFVQSLGYLFTEEIKWGADGTQVTPGTWEYKVPTAYDIPVEFNVALLQNTPNPRAMALGSKAVAEPCMCLAYGPFLALKKAIYAAREELGLDSGFVPLDVPASPDSIRNAVGVSQEHLRL